MYILEIFVTVILLTFPKVSNTTITKIYLHYSLSWPFNQSVIDISIRTYKEYRNLHNQPQALDLVIFFSNEIAKAINATLLYSPLDIDIEKDNLLGKLEYPSVLPMARVQYLNDRKSPKTLWSIYEEIQSNISTENFLPKIHQMDSLEQNFVYCAISKHKKDSIAAFMSVFVQPLDKFNWLALFVTFVLLIMIVNTNVSRSDAFFTVLFAFLSSITNGFTFVGSRAKWKHSKLLTLWIFCSMVILIEYCGNMTTNLTRPVNEITLKNYNSV